MRKNRITLFEVIIFLAICSTVVYVTVMPIAKQSSRATYTTTVTDKQVKRSGEEDKYMIFTKDDDGNVRVFENTDSLLIGKFNSSDIQATIEIGNTYEFKVYGFRIPIMSMYENVISATLVK